MNQLFGVAKEASSASPEQLQRTIRNNSVITGDLVSLRRAIGAVTAEIMPVNTPISVALIWLFVELRRICDHRSLLSENELHEVRCRSCPVADVLNSELNCSMGKSSTHRRRHTTTRGRTNPRTTSRQPPSAHPSPRRADGFATGPAAPPALSEAQPRTNICNGPVPGGPSQLVCGKPSPWLGAVIIPDAENGDAEARIDSIDDAAPFGFEDKDTIAKLELSIHRCASIAMCGPPGSF